MDNRPLPMLETVRCSAGTWYYRSLRKKFRKLGRHTAPSGRYQAVPVEHPHSAKRRLAKPQSFLQHCVEDRLEVTGRRIDDLQHLGGGGLLFECLSGLDNEPCVLHRDDRLRREVLEQRDLFLRKWPDFLPVNSDCAQ